MLEGSSGPDSLESLPPAQQAIVKAFLDGAKARLAQTTEEPEYPLLNGETVQDRREINERTTFLLKTASKHEQAGRKLAGVSVRAAALEAVLDHVVKFAPPEAEFLPLKAKIVGETAGRIAARRTRDYAQHVATNTLATPVDRREAFGRASLWLTNKHVSDFPSVAFSVRTRLSKISVALPPSRVTQSR